MAKQITKKRRKIIFFFFSVYLIIPSIAFASHTNSPALMLDLNAASLSFKIGGVRVTIGSIYSHLTLDQKDKKLKGSWRINNIQLKEAIDSFPIIEGQGNLKFQGNKIDLEGEFHSKDFSFTSQIKVKYDLNNPSRSQIIITRMKNPWNQGVLSTQNARVYLGDNRRIEAVLEVYRASLNEVMRSYIGERVSVTGGVISGKIPLKVTDKDLTVKNGYLEAEEVGILHINPSIIPGDHPQLSLVREALTNFHYTHLSIEINSEENGKLLILMHLEGHNPHVYSGQSIKLNVRLTGDILNFILGSVLPWKDPKKLLEQGIHEK